MTVMSQFRWILILTLILLPLVVQADRIEGRLNGLGCASKGKLCPIDKDDPHVLLERDFVVQTADGNYFYVTNIDWKTKLKYVLKLVRVEGRFSDRLSAIVADELWVKKVDGYHLEWSLDMVREKHRKARLEQ